VHIHKLGHDIGCGAHPEEPHIPLKVLPDQRKIAEAQQSGQTLGRGMDFALVVLVFLGVGYGLDRWLGTRPLFIIGLVLFSVVGQFMKMYFEYTATMQQHEAERAAGVQSQPRYKSDGQAA
jgi:ATP synthase protein I